MSRFNHLFQNRFASCELLADVHDHCRDRRFRIFDLGELSAEDTLVGINDGVDVWIAPAATTFPGLDLPRLMKNRKVAPRAITRSPGQDSRPHAAGRVRVQA